MLSPGLQIYTVYLSRVISIGATLIATPLLLGSFGNQMYAVYVILLTFLGF